MIKIEISRHMAKNIEKTKRPMIKIETISRHNYGQKYRKRQNDQ
jgi:hypothetical protein